MKRRRVLNRNTAHAKFTHSSKRNQLSIKRNCLRSTSITLTRPTGGCNSTDNRRYKAPNRGRRGSPAYNKNSISNCKDHSKILPGVLNEYVLESDDDFHLFDEKIDSGKERETPSNVEENTSKSFLKFCSKFCILDTKLETFSLVDHYLDKCAIVCLTDICKDTKTDQLIMNSSNSLDVPSKTAKMKSKSKSPNRQNAAKSASNEMHSVLTTYMKPEKESDNSKKPVTPKISLKDSGKKKTEYHISLFKTTDPSTLNVIPLNEMEKDSLSEGENKSSTPKVMSMNEKTPQKKGKEKSKPVAKTVSDDLVETKSPKIRKGGKAKKAEESQSVNNEDMKSSADTDDQSVDTPSKEDKKPVKTPRGRKKNVANATPAVDEEATDKKVGKKPGPKPRNVSESPSPRRKQSPKKTPEKASPKSTKKKKVGVQNAAAEVNNPLEENDNDENSGVTKDKVKASPRKSSKSPVKKRDKSDTTDSPSKVNSVNSKDTVKEKKSPKRKPKEGTTETSTEKVKSKDTPVKSPKNSPKKAKSVSPKKVKAVNVDTAGTLSKKLDFEDEDITKVIYKRSKLSLPPDFEYKYTSSIQTTGPADLSNLISKVNNAMKENNKELTELFGEAEEPLSDSDEKSTSPESSLLSTSLDSEKTVLEFDLQNNQDTEEKTNVEEPKDSDKTETENSSDIKKSEEIESKPDKSDEISSETVKDKTEKMEPELVNSDKSEENECSAKNDDSVEPGTSKELVDDSKDRKDGELDSKEDSIETDKCDNVSDDNNDDEIKPAETVSVFELYGLTLKRKNSVPTTETPPTEEKEKEKEKETTESGEKNVIDISDDTAVVNDLTFDNDDVVKDLVSDDVVVLSDTETQAETSKVDAVIVLSDDEEEGVDRTGYESLKESMGEKKVKPKFTTVNNIVEPKPLEILSRVEKAEARKESAFACDELEDYLNVHKQGGKAYTDKYDVKIGERKEKLTKDEVDDYVKKAVPDLDEIDGCVFVSFSSEQALKAHVNLEKKLDWLTEAQLKRLAQLQHMKERQSDSGTKRVTDVKSSDEQKLSFRGIPMRMMKYQKMLKQELEDILLGRQKSTEKSPFKQPVKTTDITKIKGWKNKYQNQEERQEATGINISDNGKVHWKTEERLVKNLYPGEIKDIELDLKKKRRKLVSYTNRSRSKDGEGDFEYELDEFAITEHDVYNEDDDKPPPEKIPYKCKYLSQHKYGARKMFVKRMNLDAEDERILQKLGTQKIRIVENGDSNLTRPKKPECSFVLSKISHNMAVTAVSALDKKLLTKAKNLAKAEAARLKKRGPILEEPSHTVTEPDDLEDNPAENDDELASVKVKEEPDNDYPQEVETKRGSRSRGKGRRHSSVSKNSDNVPNNDVNEASDKPHIKVERASSETCAEPGCRYGCICHLCKLSDSGEERETDHRPQCDKEYCRLGCICDSIDTANMDKQHCKKPGCMIECKCPPKQPKPDIPREREHGKRKKKGRGRKKKSTPQDKNELGNEDGEEVVHEDGEWEPPSKRKRGASGSRFSNLPKRETTYRLAKNLDAVSRKAMDIYATSEMYADMKTARRRRSDQGWEDDWPEKKRPAEPRLNEFTGVMEISDEETYPDGLESCARLQPYMGPFKQQKLSTEESQKTNTHLNKRKGGPSGKRSSQEVIELDSDTETGSNRRESRQSNLPSTSGDQRKPQTLTEKMGLVNLIRNEKEGAQAAEPCVRWKTQMVCLKAKKKSLDDTTNTNQAEIKLLEIMSNCNWEIDRTNMLSKISHIISKDSGVDYPNSQKVSWGAYVLEFLPKADVPAVIPRELKSKLPKHIFSIRIKVTRDQSSTSSSSSSTEATGKDRLLTMEERKRHIMKWQKKLIDKIKFAERLRNLIITEEQNGVENSKFSVTREGIEKALKKYKTQLWKAYTGSSNLTLQQLKQALQAAKNNAGAKAAAAAEADKLVKGNSRPNVLSSATKARLHSTGVTVIGGGQNASGGQKFINLSNLSPPAPCSTSLTSNVSTSSFGKIVIHQAEGNAAGHSHLICKTSTGMVSTKTSSADGSIVTATKSSSVQQRPAKPGPGSMGKIPKRILPDTTGIRNLPPTFLLKHPIPSTGPIGQPLVDQSRMPSATGSGKVEDVVLMPLDKTVNPSALPPGVKLAVIQPDTGLVKTIVLPSSVTTVNTNSIPSNAFSGQNLRMASPAMNSIAISSLAAVRSHSPGIMIPVASRSVVPTGVPVPTYPGQGPMPSVTFPYPVTQVFPSKAMTVISSVPSSVSNVPMTTSMMCSPSIYPIQFANTLANSNTSSEICVQGPDNINAPSKIQVQIPAEMIGMPKLSNGPFKLYSAGKDMAGKPVLVPISGTFSEGSTISKIQSMVTSRNVSPSPTNAAANSAMSAGSSNSNSVNDKTVQDKHVNNRKINIKPNTSNQGTDKVDGVEVAISDTDTMKVSKGNIEIKIEEQASSSAEVEKLVPCKTVLLNDPNGVVVMAQDSVLLSNNDSTKGCEKIDNASSVNSETSAEKLDKSIEDIDNTDKPVENHDKQFENIDIKVENIDKSAEIISKPIEIIDVKSNNIDHEADTDSILDIKIADVKSIRDEHLEDGSAMKNSNLQSDDLGVEMLPHSELAPPPADATNGKRASPDLLDLIDMEQTMKQMDEMETAAGIKTNTADDAIQIEDSEESDVDIMTCDTLESSDVCKRKAPNSDDEDDSNSKRFKSDEVNALNEILDGDDAPKNAAKKSREKSRRHQLRVLFDELEQVVFKYNPEMQTMRGTIPKHLILQEAYGLTKALNQRQEYLKECSEDGKQYKVTLQAKLDQQIRDFASRGVPEKIIQNFLKGCQGLMSYDRRRKQKIEMLLKRTSAVDEAEEDDSNLEFKPLSKSRFRNDSDDNYESVISGNQSAEGEFGTTNPNHDPQTTVPVNCSNLLQTDATEVIANPTILQMDVPVSNSPFVNYIKILKRPFAGELVTQELPGVSLLRNHARIVSSGTGAAGISAGSNSDIFYTQENQVQCLSQGNTDQPLAEVTHSVSDRNNRTVDTPEVVQQLTTEVSDLHGTVEVSDDEDIQSTTGDVMLFENESMGSDHSNSNDAGDGLVSNNDHAPV